MKRLFLLGLILAFATLAHAQTASDPIYQMVDLHRLVDQTFASPAYLVGQFTDTRTVAYFVGRLRAGDKDVAWPDLARHPSLTKLALPELR